MIKHLLQGRPFGHPLHPILNHFPIALFVLSLLLDVATLFGYVGNALVLAAFYTMALGVVMGVLAAITGLADYLDIRADHPGKRNATLHMTLNLVMLVLYALNLNLRNGDLGAESTPMLPFVLSLVGVGILSLSGYLGGQLVYDEGVGVGRHLRKANVPQQTVKVLSSRAGDDGFLAVANEGALSEGETLRVQVDRVVMAVAKVEGKTYAFQEFCTHRFGPLSEGNFHGHEVQCPWHQSCFDVRTGKVTQGPAKVDLNVYETKVQGGKILVRVPVGDDEG
ncbi:MAG: Rieske 2Fe-2S domain-containing protein [Chloroflexota bacterium]|nr:Rieske 2Fe-2S domain-containing protein [Chloroflexota bacterium]